MACSAPGCKNVRRFKPEGVSFHMFPRGDLLNKWLDVLGKNKDTWIWTKYKFVCSEHFYPEDVVLKGGKSVLKVNAVPHIVVGTSSKSLSALSESSLSLEHSVAQEQSKTTPGKELESSTTSSSSQQREKDILSARGPFQPLKRKLSKTRTSATDKHETSTTSTDSSTKRRRVTFIKTIHNYSVSPRKFKSQHAILKKKQGQVRKRLYVATKRITSLKKKIHCLKSVVSALQQQNLLSENALDHLQTSYTSVPRLLMSRYLKNVQRGTVTHETYPAALRQFACVLQFYSSKAYEFVRKEFSLAVPHQATIRKWCTHIDCSPGYIEPAFQALKNKVAEAIADNVEIICSLIIDEVAIKKQIDFDGKRMWGYVDVGVQYDNDDVQPATEAFVVMVVAHNSHWKLPVAYFLIKSLTAREKANIVKESLFRLHEIGIQITSVTFDGPTVNISMMKELGCDIADVHDMKTSFVHPSDETISVSCVLDPCHMLKLMRNALASLGSFKDPEGGIISWHYITALYNLQESVSLNIANKLKRSHIEWYKQKMKVHLAAQTLSSSVADALEFVSQVLQLKEFEGCEATISFIRRMDQLFDVLNSKSPWAKGFKAPLRVNNEQKWRPFLAETIHYLLYCTDVSGRPIWCTPRKTPFLGFAITCLSVCHIFDNYVKTDKLKYLLTYKCSQDHLEIFFCSVRSRNGWNNNPTALQFARTFKRLLLHSKISGRGGNCKVLDTTTVLTVPSTTSKKDYTQYFDISLYRKYNLDPADQQLQDHDYDIIMNFIPLDDVTANVVTYISGYVVKTLPKKLKCIQCLAETGSSLEISEDSYKLLCMKNRGGLYVPCSGIVSICSRVETSIKKVMNITDNILPQETTFYNYFTTIVAQQFYEKINSLFPTLKDHFLESEPNHGFLLVKEVVQLYSRIRFFNLAKKYTYSIQGSNVRRQLNKLILFSHQ